jgi:hypothetical protein
MSSTNRSVLRRRARATLPAAGVALLLALTGCAASTADETASADGPDVVVSDAWVRATEGTDDPSMTGAFMAIDNEGEEDVSLTGASSPVAGAVELHEMAMVDGSMVMRKIDGGIEIQAGFGQALMPGGNHVMLMGLSEELAPGDEVELVLEFSDGSSQELTVPVKEFTEEEGHYHESDGPHSHPGGSMGDSPSMSPSGSANP